MREKEISEGSGIDYDGRYFFRTSVTAQDALDRAAALLAGVEGGVRKALRSATSKAAARLQRSNVNAVRERYAISAAGIRANENVHVTYSYRDGVQALVEFNGKRIPLYRFDGVSPRQPTKDTSADRAPAMIKSLVGGRESPWRMAYPGVPASGRVLKSRSPYQLDAFVAEMDNGHISIFERTDEENKKGIHKIKQLFGPSVPQMPGSVEVASKLADEAMASFEKDLDQAVLAILSGYM